MASCCSSRSARRSACAPPTRVRREPAALRRGRRVVAALAPRQVRTLALTDLAWARAARVAAFAGIAREQPRAIIYSTITAALLAPAPGRSAWMP